jgi:hypothetical protein
MISTPALPNPTLISDPIRKIVVIKNELEEENI